MAAPDKDAQFRRDLILTSAFFHAPPPSDRIVSNCHRVLRHALIAAGLWEEGWSAAFHGEEDELARFPLVSLWYSTLIALTRDEPEAERLLEGGGNLVTPAGAYFTACWLTPKGRDTAQRLLAEHPELQTRLCANAE